MGETEVNKAIITAINAIILLGLPGMLIWHIRRVKTKKHLSDEWIIQLMFVFLYIISITAEIPALWVRWESYYVYNLPTPESLYKLTTWDRWSHLIFYVVLMVLSSTITRKKIPAIIKDTIAH